MPISHEVVYGGLLENNMPPADVPKAVIHVPGEFKGKKTPFGLTEEMLSNPKVVKCVLKSSLLI